jgi:LCP family protein required for cell wall assembly
VVCPDAAKGIISAPVARPVPNEEGLRALTEGSGGTTSAGRAANEDGLLALGQAVDAARRRGRGGRHGKPRRFTKTKWVLAVVLVIAVLIAGSGAGYAWYLNHEIQRIAIKGITPDPTSGADRGTQNILLVGSTSRCALTVQNPAYGLCSEGVNGVNSDVVMILHLNPQVPSASILSIPRDLFVPNARAEGGNKIDAALYEGPTQLVAAIEEDFGIPINHFVELNFDSFANVVDALGGINMYFPEPVFDQYSGLLVPVAGCRHLDGVEALQVVRARHLQYQAPGNTDPIYQDWPQETQSDLARIRRDHEFLRVLATAVAKRGLSNPLTDEQLVAGVVGQLTVDSGFSASGMVNMALTYHGVNIRKAPQLTVPVEVDQFGDYYFEGGDYGDIEFPAQPQDQAVVDQFLGVTAGTDTMTGTKLPAPSSVSVSVLNGSGGDDQAASTAQALSALGFDIVGTGDTEIVAQQVETLVTYGQRTPADEAAAQAVADSLTGEVTLAYGPTTDGAQVTVTTGTDFSVNPPAPPPTTTTTGRGSTTSPSTAPPTTTTTTLPSDGEFSAPSQAVEALAPWDPRSCTPTGGEGP